MITLFQFPISHYCEKIRWALDYKNLEYETHNLLPGLHLLTTKKLAPQTSVPIIKHENQIIQGSEEIISYLDLNFPERPLSPDSSALAEQALQWERYADQEIGVPVRLCAYHILLQHPDIVIPMFTVNGPWYGKPLIKLIYPALENRMRTGMKINAANARQSKLQLNTAIDRVCLHLQENPFMVGDSFTRADLTVAALLAPFYLPVGYGINWPENLPLAMDDLIAELSERMIRIANIYDQYR